MLRGARTRLARKPAALARELLRNFPKGKGRRGRRRKKRPRRARTASGGRNGNGARGRSVAVDAGENGERGLPQPAQGDPSREAALAVQRRAGGDEAREPSLSRAPSARRRAEVHLARLQRRLAAAVEVHHQAP